MIMQLGKPLEEVVPSYCSQMLATCRALLDEQFQTVTRVTLLGARDV